LARKIAAAEKEAAKARAGKNSFPPTPFLFARPSDWILKFGIRIFVKKCSNINQKTPDRQLFIGRDPSASKAPRITSIGK